MSLWLAPWFMEVCCGALRSALQKLFGGRASEEAVAERSNSLCFSKWCSVSSLSLSWQSGPHLATELLAATLPARDKWALCLCPLSLHTAPVVQMVSELFSTFSWLVHLLSLFQAWCNPDCLHHLAVGPPGHSSEGPELDVLTGNLREVDCNRNEFPLETSSLLTWSR